jgi:hypothetical protein
VPLNVIQRQLSHANLGTTSIYLQGIDSPATLNEGACLRVQAVVRRVRERPRPSDDRVPR